MRKTGELRLLINNGLERRPHHFADPSHVLATIDPLNGDIDIGVPRVLFGDRNRGGDSHGKSAAPHVDDVERVAREKTTHNCESEVDLARLIPSEVEERIPLVVRGLSTFLKPTH